MFTPPTVLAFDFDGVICDGLIEYFQTAWRAYSQLFPDPPSAPPPGLAEQFYPLRPVVETGWEMPILLRALLHGVDKSDILVDWPAIAPQILTQTNLTSAQAAAAVDSVRDTWIKTDLDNWLAQHRFYPGVLERLQAIQSSDCYLVIISTKEGRFIRQLLAQQGLDLAPEQIIGKEIKQPKYQTLRQMRQAKGGDVAVVWFVEDRLKALQAVTEQADLADIQLFLADWGYNLERDRGLAQDDSRLHLLSLAQLIQDFSAWVG
ncbi:MAG: HAD family hydrolase [Cyanobacteria bacterium P01_A01_bin.123]